MLFLGKRWVRFGNDLELLDSPGILPMRISDQTAAIKLAICDDIGERSYDVVDVAAVLIQMLTKLPSVGKHVSYSLCWKSMCYLLKMSRKENLLFLKYICYNFKILKYFRINQN